MGIRKLQRALGALTWALSLGTVWAADCRNVQTYQSEQSWVARLAQIQQKIASDRCDSLALVLKKLASNHKPGGRQLEASQSLDPQQAQQQVQMALKDKETAAELVSIGRDYSDEFQRLVAEAVLFDAEGHYLARDLRIKQAQLLLRGEVGK